MAISDELMLTAQGLDTIERRNNREDYAVLRGLAAEMHIGLILVGNPIRMSGEEGRQAQWVRQFADALATQTRLPVQLWDERLTTVEAGRVLRQSGISIEKRARAIDRLSAVVLLQNYLDTMAIRKESE